MLPGAAASCLSGATRHPAAGGGDSGDSRLSADHADFFAAQRTFWQQLAWLFSAVFWCALGALCFLFICARLDTRRNHSSEE
ncbi:hypothetical protein DMH27_23570 [Raoultella planticola]|nr:hypothetical protein [Raoultella planticola]